MCKGKEKFAGIVRARAAEQRAVHLPGYSGLTLVRYTGSKESGRLPPTLWSGVSYGYGTQQPLFYADARDLTIVLAWHENGQQVFWVDGTKETVDMGGDNGRLYEDH
jgi:hypothetical protein